MKSNTRRAFAASLLAIGGALAASPARAREWGGRRDGGGDGGDHEHHGDGGGGQQHHEGWRDGAGQQQNFKQDAPRHEFRQQGGGGQQGGAQQFQGGGGGGGRQWSRPSVPHVDAPHVEEHHEPIVQGGPQFQGGGDRTRSWQGGGDRVRSFQGGGGQAQNGDGRWQGGSVRSFQGGGDRNSWQGGGERRQVWNGGGDGGGRRDWIRDHGADHNWNRGEWDGRYVQRVNQGRYFNNAHARIVGRYFNRRAIYFSSGGFYGAWRYPWRVGYVLPAYVNYWPIPYDLYDELPPCPYGYDYCQVDGGAILLLSLITGLIVDAILFL